MQKGRLRKDALSALVLQVWSVLENVTQLKLPDASSVDVANVEIAGTEPEVVERGIRHVSRSRCELGRVEGVKVIKANLKTILLQRSETKIDRLGKTQIQTVLFWSTQNIATREPCAEGFTDQETNIRWIDRITVKI